MQLLQPICFPTCCCYGAKRQSRSRLTDHRVLMARRGKRGMGAKACRMEGFLMTLMCYESLLISHPLLWFSHD